MKKGFVLFFLVLCVPVFVFAGYFDEPLYGSTGSHITSLSEVANSLQKIKPALKRLMALPVLNAPHYGEKFRFNPTDFSYEHKISFGEKNQIVNIQTTFKLAEKFLDTATYDDIEPLVFTCLELIAFWTNACRFTTVVTAGLNDRFFIIFLHSEHSFLK